MLGEMAQPPSLWCPFLVTGWAAFGARLPHILVMERVEVRNLVVPIAPDALRKLRQTCHVWRPQKTAVRRNR